MSEASLVHCPNCNTDSLVRVIGAGAGLIFKGTGFYLTDYKKENQRLDTSSKKKEEKASEKKESPPQSSGESNKKPTGEGSPPSKKD